MQKQKRQKQLRQPPLQCRSSSAKHNIIYKKSICWSKPGHGAHNLNQIHIYCIVLVVVLVVCSCDNDGKDSGGGGGCCCCCCFNLQEQNTERENEHVFKSHFQYQVYTRFYSTKCNMNRLLYMIQQSQAHLNHSFCLLYSGIARTNSGTWVSNVYVCVRVCVRGTERKRNERN